MATKRENLGRYNPPTRPRVDIANYMIVDENVPIKEGFTRLALGAGIAVETSWLYRVDSYIGPRTAGRPIRGDYEVIKRMIDGFYEPWEIGITGGSERFEGNIIYESLKCYAQHRLQMGLSEFKRAWNQKMGTSRRTLKNLRWKDKVQV